MEVRHSRRGSGSGGPLSTRNGPMSVVCDVGPLGPSTPTATSSAECPTADGRKTVKGCRREDIKDSPPYTTALLDPRQTRTIFTNKGRRRFFIVSLYLH